MNIAILGAGAMGSVLGAYLAEGGLDPLLIDVYREHIDKINADGLRIVGCADKLVPIRAVSPDAIPGRLDLVFLFVKQTASRQALSALLPHLASDATVCTLQNGFPEPLVAEIVGAERAIGGACLWGATFIGPGIAELTNDLASRLYLFEIGELDGRVAPRTGMVAEVLGKMGPVEITDNLAGARWLKLMLNCSMSGMSAALGCVFGDILANDKALACLSHIAAEVVRVCRASGAVMTRTNNLDADAIADFATRDELERSKGFLFRNYAALRTAKASMLQDLEAGRKTEIDMINGFVCDIGRKYGVPTPYNDMVRGIVKRIEEGELLLSFSNLDMFDVPALK